MEILSFFPEALLQILLEHQGLSNNFNPCDYSFSEIPVFKYNKFQTKNTDQSLSNVQYQLKITTDKYFFKLI